jgi:hypothetical protein
MAYDSIFKDDLFAARPSSSQVVAVASVAAPPTNWRPSAPMCCWSGARPTKLQSGRHRNRRRRRQGDWKVCDIRDEEAVTHLVSELIRTRADPRSGQQCRRAVPVAAGLDQSERFRNRDAHQSGGRFPDGREVFNQSMSKHGGAIVNMLADMWGGMPGMGHSGAARSGMDNFTKTCCVRVGLRRGAGQRRGAGLDRVQRHGHLRRRVQGGDSDLARTCAAQTHRHRIGSQRGDCFPAQPGRSVHQRQHLAHRWRRQPRRTCVADSQGDEQRIVSTAFTAPTFLTSSRTRNNPCR